MGAGVPTAKLEAAKRRLEKKTGKRHVILRASNGECAVVTQEYLDACRNWVSPQQNPPGGRPESWGPLPGSELSNVLQGKDMPQG
jgi:hypothetical protein